MNIAEEKQFLYGMMKDITEERRRLTDMYFSLKERIDHLHKLEERGIGELSTKGFIDLFNDRETQIQITNLNRETQFAIQRREKELQKPRYDKVAETLERGQADRAEREAQKERQRLLDEAKEKSDEAEKVKIALFETQQIVKQLEQENRMKKGDSPVIEEAEEVIEPIQEEESIAEEVEVVEQKKTRGPGKKEKKVVKKRESSQLTLKKSIELISEILIEHGMPLKASVLHQRLVEKSGKNITIKNFQSNIMQRALATEPRIERAQHGYYQYNRNAR